MKTRLAVLVVLSGLMGAAAAEGPSSFLAGTVTTPLGMPAAGAFVAAIPVPGREPAGTARTDASGHYHISGLPPGKYAVTATAPRLEAVFRGGVTLESGKAAPAVDLQLGKGGATVTVVVRDRKGNPVSSSRLLAERSSMDEGDVFEGLAEGAGRFALTLPKGLYLAAVSAPGFEAESVPVTLDGDRTLSVRLLTPAEHRAPLTEAATSALRSVAIPLTTVEAGHGFTDMQRLKALVGRARVVALGEATHGTREFFQMKHRMLEFLVSEMGFNVFAIEANWPESLAVDDYVLEGKGDPALALSGLYFWTWNTEEVLEMIRWMRRYNEDPAHTVKVRFAGIDMQFPAVAARAVDAYFAKADADAPTAVGKVITPLLGGNPRETWSRLSESERGAIHGGISEAYGRFEAKKSSLVARSSEKEWAVARHHARILCQFEESVHPGEVNVRDRSMAENVQWILENEGPSAKVVLWAHNGHVSFDPAALFRPMGADLKKALGPDLVVLGFAFNEGAFQAIRMGLGLDRFSVSPAGPGWLEAGLSQLGLPIFVLDLRNVPPGDASDWLAIKRPARSIGAVFDDAQAESAQFVVRQVAADAYDGLLYVGKTTAARSNPGAAVAKAGPSPAPQPPPSPAALNLDFEQGDVGQVPPGWRVPKSISDAGYTAVLSDDHPHDGKRDAVVRSSKDAGPPRFGNLMQRIDATTYRGKKIRLRAAVRVTDGEGRLWLRVDRKGGGRGFFDNMEDRPIRDKEWTFHEIVGPVSDDAEAIAFGVMLIGDGEVFVDSVSIEEAR